ncbi:hypothetical protein F511_28320 [Dorcoceras hygrometricum]|uniref:Uncharacterized protein n=1 Tax=Dorcoceras hygrometricum TaxID=472368 RepID=A0A2Z7ARR3_9LAMI|nr:hypothetical protein F511_28320 [Dorcoceras hygrometricum]
MAIESLTTLDLPMVVDSIGIYEMKGPYYTLTMTDWFLQALSVIPMGSWVDVARHFTMLRWIDQKMCFLIHNELTILVLATPGTKFLKFRCAPGARSGSDAGRQQITFGSGIEIRKEDWYKASLPQIEVVDKVKAPLVEKDEIKGHPAREMFSLICSDIEFLVLIRKKVIEEISSLFSSFSLRLLEILELVSDIAAKEEQKLAWAETDSLQTAVSRHLYIIAKRLILLNEAWPVIEGADKWVRECKTTTSCEQQQLSQRPFVDAFAPICIFVEPVQDLGSQPPFIRTWGWARVCVYIVQFNLFGHLFPVGTYNLCTDIVAVGPVVDRSAVPKRILNVFSIVYKVSMTFRVVRTNQYNQDLGLIHSTNGNHLESPNEGSSTDHQFLGVHCGRGSSDRVSTEAVHIKSSSETFLKRKKGRRRI